jgi:hypothetical protein
MSAFNLPGYCKGSASIARKVTTIILQRLCGLRFDNLKSAVKKVLRGYRREETSRFIAFRSHWRFQSEFCNPARGNEKGGVEGEGGYFRRNHWVPLPQARDLDELNAYLERCCREDQSRVLSGRSDTVGTAMLTEQAYLLPLAAEPFELAEISFPMMDGLRCVRVRTSRYSVPLRPGTRIEARVNADSFELWHGGQATADLSALSRSAARGRDGRTRTQHHSPAHQGRPPAAHEDTG